MKRYYWLKLRNDFFKTKEIKKLRKIAGGDTYTIIYLKMQLLSLKNEGKIFYDGVEETFAEELALDLDEDTDNVTVTLAFLEKCNLIEKAEDDQFLLPEAVSAIGSESSATARVRRYREKEKALQCNAAVTECNKNVTLEIEKEIEIRDIPPIIPQGDVGAAEKSPKSDGAQRKKAGRTNRYEYTSEFEAFWAVYPRQADKVSGFAKFKECLKAGVPLEELLVAAKNYAGYVKKYNTEEPRILHAKTFLGPTKRYEEFTKGAGLFGQSTSDDRSAQGENAGETDWSNYFKPT